VIVELVTWAAARLADPATGLVATLPSFPNTTLPLPGDVRVLNAYDQAWTARGDLPEKELEAGPLVIVRQAGETELAFMAEDESRQGDVHLALHYGALGSKLHVEYQVAHAVLRTCQRVLTQAFAWAGEEPEPEQHGVFIQRPTRVTYLPPFDEGSDAVISVACVVPFPVHDAWALGAPVP
jgi:hypothetical protein